VNKLAAPDPEPGCMILNTYSL